MEAETRPLAIVIDDAYALPSADDVRVHWKKLRKYLRGDAHAMAWFVSTFEAEDVNDRDYVNELASAEPLRDRLWATRSDCPSPGYDVAIADILSACRAKREMLEEIEQGLLNYSVQRFSQVPTDTELLDKVSVVVLDYILFEDVPEGSAAQIDESIAFVQKLADRGATAGRWPLVILVSTIPTLREKAKEFKEMLNGLHGGFFRVVPKQPGATVNQVQFFTGAFHTQQEELNAFRRFHLDFKASLIAAVTALQGSIDGLELQDLAALQVGQLSVEHESLGDYLAWLCGQSLAGKLQESGSVAASAAALPEKSYKILLGHLEPSKGIPQLFTEVSMVRPATAAISYRTTGRRGLRFGDVFRTIDNPPAYYLVASQTCDLLHCKLANGQVLCIQGSAEVFGTDEAALLHATVKQMTEGRSTLKVDGRFMQIEWQPKSLRTIPQVDLETDAGFEYVGRLNEIYALEVQQNAAHELTRIGVPIKPNFGYFFDNVQISAWSKGAQIAGVAASLGGGTIEAVLRPEKDGRNVLLMSADLQNKLGEILAGWRDSTAVAGEGAKKVQAVTELVAKLAADLTSESFRLQCKPKKGGGVSAVLGSAAETNASVDLAMLEIVFPEIEMFPGAESSPGTCVRLEFKKM